MAMQTFTGFENLLLDAANQFGMDKEHFDVRLDWARDNLTILEALVDDADEKAMFHKSVLAIRKAQAKQPTGHLVGFDATASGLQIMCAMIGCETGGRLVNLTDPSHRYDAYTEGVHGMNVHLAPHQQITLDGSGHLTRKHVKDGIMTHFYGSQKQPKIHFGEDTEELAVFYKMLDEKFPGASQLMKVLLHSWQPYALKHSWVLDDGFHVEVPTVDKKDVKVEVDELGGCTFTHRLELVMGLKFGLHLAANIIHSIDGMVVREMKRRCGYDGGKLARAMSMIISAIAGRPRPSNINCDEFLSLRWINELTGDKVSKLSLGELYRALDLIEQCLAYRSFEILAVHDEFKCHANHVNQMRYWYKEILAELAESNLLERIINRVRGTNGTLTKLSNRMPDLIRESNYALS